VQAILEYLESPDNPGQLATSEAFVLVILGWFSDENCIAYPSIPRIARRTRLSTDQARRCVHALIDLHRHVEVVSDVPGRSRRYRIKLETLKTTPRTDARGEAKTTPRTDARGNGEGTPGMQTPNPSHGRQDTPCTGASLKTLKHKEAAHEPRASAARPLALKRRKDDKSLRTFFRTFKNDRPSGSSR
jgi:hypothetical protein